jgi:hypothetical protein
MAGCPLAAGTSGKLHDNGIDGEAVAWPGLDLRHCQVALGAQHIFRHHRLDGKRRNLLFETARFQSSDYPKLGLITHGGSQTAAHRRAAAVQLFFEPLKSIK